MKLLSHGEHMNYASLMMPFWALSTTSLFLFVDAKLDHSFISDSHFSSGKEPFFLFSSNMDAHSPGMTVAPVVEVVHHQDLNKRILIALIVASTLLAAILLSLACCWIYRINSLKSSNVKARRSSVEVTAKERSPNLVVDKFGSPKSSQRKSSVEVMEFQLLKAATNNFEEDNVLAKGRRGLVYKARLNENLLVAIKRMEGEGQDVRVEFENEVNWLVKIWHQNIISLMGCCIHAEAYYIVYEMMQNGSLDSQLHGPTRGSALSWNLRMKIAVDIARGLEYLHEHCNPPVVHRDLKSSNILLDSNFDAKLSDFGLAVTSGIQNKNIKLSEISGYVAPEYNLDGKLTDKSDVYAFGVVLLELLIGRKPVEKTESAEYQSLVTWAMPKLTDRSKLPNIVDPVIRDTMDLKHLYQVAAVAVLCVQQEPSYRPLITDVLHSLIPLVPLEPGGSLRVTEPTPPDGNYH